MILIKRIQYDDYKIMIIKDLLTYCGNYKQPDKTARIFRVLSFDVQAITFGIVRPVIF